MLETYRNTAELIDQQQPELPVNCLSLAVLKDHVTRFCKGFPGTVAYAVKANPATPLLHGLSDLGIKHFDVASVTEIELLRSIQEDATLLYDNPVKSR
ncbi:MAG: type III PLP-dependent enzyme, partial [Pseudomonadales bacterium]